MNIHTGENLVVIVFALPLK